MTGKLYLGNKKYPISWCQISHIDLNILFLNFVDFHYLNNTHGILLFNWLPKYPTKNCSKCLIKSHMITWPESCISGIRNIHMMPDSLVSFYRQVSFYFIQNVNRYKVFRIFVGDNTSSGYRANSHRSMGGKPHICYFCSTKCPTLCMCARCEQIQGIQWSNRSNRLQSFLH